MSAIARMPPAPNLSPYARSVRLDPELSLFLYEAGDRQAPPLVLIHGLGDEADSWRHVLEPLAADHRVIALDLPGFGRSDKPRRAYSLGYFARTVARLLDLLGVARPTLVGSSLGAAVAQRVALASPERVERLVLVGGALPLERGLPPAPLWWFLTPGVGELAYTSLRRSQDEAFATLRPYYADLDALPAADREFLRERVWARVWSDEQRRAFLSALRWLAVERALRAPQLRARVTGLVVPTLLVWGEHDRIVPRGAADDLLTLVSGARLEVVPGAGHLPHQERPAAFVSLLTASRAHAGTPES
jgi:pimeloyl-ACP methyl ester carboxylesterase